MNRKNTTREENLNQSSKWKHTLPVCLSVPPRLQHPFRVRQLFWPWSESLVGLRDGLRVNERLAVET